MSHCMQVQKTNSDDYKLGVRIFRRNKNLVKNCHLTVTYT